MIEIIRTACCIIPASHLRKTGISVPLYVFILQGSCSVTMSESENENKSVLSGQTMRFEQCNYIHIKVLCGKTSKKIRIALTEVGGTNAVEFTAVKCGSKLFTEGCRRVEGKERCGRAAAVCDDKTNALIIATLLDKDRRMMVEMEVNSRIPKTILHCILTSILQKHKISALWVLHFLSAQ